MIQSIQMLDMETDTFSFGGGFVVQFKSLNDADADRVINDPRDLTRLCVEACTSGTFGVWQKVSFLGKKRMVRILSVEDLIKHFDKV